MDSRIFVDDYMVVKSIGRSTRYASGVWSHLWSADQEALHGFAQRAGLAREWFQGDHYDVTQSLRSKCIGMGAIPIKTRHLVKLRKSARAGAGQ